MKFYINEVILCDIFKMDLPIDWTLHLMASRAKANPSYGANVEVKLSGELFEEYLNKYKENQNDK